MFFCAVVLCLDNQAIAGVWIWKVAEVGCNNLFKKSAFYYYAVNNSVWKSYSKLLHLKHDFWVKRVIVAVASYLNGDFTRLQLLFCKNSACVFISMTKSGYIFWRIFNNDFVFAINFAWINLTVYCLVESINGPAFAVCESCFDCIRLAFKSLCNCYRFNTLLIQKRNRCTLCLFYCKSPFARCVVSVHGCITFRKNTVENICFFWIFC